MSDDHDDHDTMLDRISDAFDHDPYDDDWAAQLDRWSIGWVTAHDGDELVGFVNVLGDGGVHAWIQDTIVATAHQRRGIGKALVDRVVAETLALGCEWLHVDFDEEHRPFYWDACGFEPTNAGLIRLTREEGA